MIIINHNDVFCSSNISHSGFYVENSLKTNHHLSKTAWLRMTRNINDMQHNTILYWNLRFQIINFQLFNVFVVVF